MLSPIAQLVKLAGEVVTLTAPPAAAAYDPTQPGDFAPPTPTVTALKGVPVDPDVLDAAGAKAGVTILASALPPGLDPVKAVVAWRGDTWRVLTVQPRYWSAKLDGYSLMLQI